MASPLQQELIAPSASYRSRGILEQDAEKKLFVGLITLAILLCLSPYYVSISPWIGVGIFMGVMVTTQLILGLKTQVPLHMVMLFNYSLQLCLASIPLYFFPPLKLYDIGVLRYPTYLAYAVPACLAIYIGVSLGTFGIQTRPFTAETVTRHFPAWGHFADLFVWGGIVCLFLGSHVNRGSSFHFVIVLLSDLRWVGLFIMILTGRKRWWIYALLLGGLETVIALRTEMFHELFLWLTSTFLITAYRFRWQGRVVVLVAVAIMFLGVFQGAKYEFRKDVSNTTTSATRFSIISGLVLDELANPAMLLDSDRLPMVFVRFNQGWIVDRVMRFVPAVEPYAAGSTLEGDVSAALLPRLIDQTKTVAGGRELFTKYTGMILDESTSMCIATTGEMYANFGLEGGILAMLVFGILIGLLYRRLATWAYDNPLWWAWGPFVGLLAMKAEEDLVNILNWIVKSLVILAFIVFVSSKFSSGRSAPTVAGEPGIDINPGLPPEEERPSLPRRAPANGSSRA